jgi:uncharacterized membrane protein
METPPANPSADQRLSNTLTALVGLVVAIIAIVFVFETDVFTSHWYAVFKVVHVAGAVFWVGGGLTLTVLALAAERASDPREMALIAKQAAFIGERFFAPAGLIVFAMGLAMVTNLNLDWGQFWIVAGLVGYALTFLTGLLVLGPKAKRIGKLLETKGPEAAETQAAIRRILLLARFDEGVLLLVVADMVLKPFS